LVDLPPGGTRSARPLWTSNDIAKATGGRIAGGEFAATGVSIDSRDIGRGDLFVALTGARDGHDFAPLAFAAGAAGVLASREVDGPRVVVEDTFAALQALATAARDRAAGAVRGAVTGSVGKTTVTQLVRAGLDALGHGHGSVKSYNNHLGVPLTLARMPADTRGAIFEIGMNHALEILPLSQMVCPHAVAITTVEAVHVENFADGEAGVARAKAEIFAGLEPDGVAILNADNRWFDLLRAAALEKGARIVAFGAGSDVEGRVVDFRPDAIGATVSALVDGRAVVFPVSQSARHWGPMSVCALLMLRALRVDLDTAVMAISNFQPLPGRGAVRRVNCRGGEFILVDESYNASPVSVAAAVAALGARPAEGRRIAVLTDMLELGAQSRTRHAELAGAVEDAKIDAVFCAGPLMASLYAALPASRRGAHAMSVEDLYPNLAREIGPGDVVMIKGSHDSRASWIVDRLVTSADQTKLEGR